MNDSPEVVVIDLASFGVIVATLAGWLPAIASLLAIIWTAIRIWETKTVQGWVMRKAKAEVVAAVVKAADDPTTKVTPRMAEAVKQVVEEKINP
jgi:hypothetical protein